MNGYQLTRQWFDFAYKNHQVKAQHTALYCWCVELNNRLQWKESFGLPTDEAREYTGIGNRNTFYAALNDLKNWGFIKEIQSSINQSQSRIISLRLSENAQAAIQAEDKQSTSTDTGSDTIDKQSKHLNNENNNIGKPKAKRKKEKVQFVPPTIEQFQEYFNDKAYPLQLVEKVFNHYNDKQWHKSNGQPVIDWKRTISNNWEDYFQQWRQRQTTNVNRGSSQPPVDPSQIVNYGKGNGQCLFDRIAKKWYEPLHNGQPPKEIIDYAMLDQGNHSNYVEYVRWMLMNHKNPMPPEDTKYFPTDWNFEKFVSEQKAILATSNQ
jgi:hypothetical protein